MLPKEFSFYKAHIGKGNNNTLVKNVIKSRYINRN